MHTKNPGIKNIASICQVLNIPIDYLTTGTGIKLFEHYRNVHMFERLCELSDEEYRIFTKTLTMQYEILIDIKKALSKDTE